MSDMLATADAIEILRGARLSHPTMPACADEKLLRIEFRFDLELRDYIDLDPNHDLRNR